MKNIISKLKNKPVIFTGIIFGLFHLIFYLIMPARHGSPVIVLELPLYFICKFLFNYNLFSMPDYKYYIIDIKLSVLGTLFYFFIGMIVAYTIKIITKLTKSALRQKQN